MNRVFAIFILLLLAIGVNEYVYSATGDKPNQMVVTIFSNITSSGFPATCKVGELRRNSSYVFMCLTSGQWRKLPLNPVSYVNQMNLPFTNVSSSFKPSGCTLGELRRNDKYVFLCASSNHWRRISFGTYF